MQHDAFNTSKSWIESSNQSILRRYGAYIPPSKKMYFPEVIVQSDEEFKECYKARYPWMPVPWGTKGIKTEEGTIFLNKDRVDMFTITHELLHYYCSQVFSTMFRNFSNVRIDEGVTEYFTQQISQVRRGAYEYPLGFAKGLAEKVGEETLRRAYFGGGRRPITKVRQALLHLVYK